MGWVALTISAAIYFVIPKVYKTEVYSVKLANLHFWLVLVGQLIFSVTMWFTGIQQGLMLMDRNADGTLAHTFIDAIRVSRPFWIWRGIGGVIFFAGFLVFIYNIIKTIQQGKTARQLAA